MSIFWNVEWLQFNFFASCNKADDKNKKYYYVFTKKSHSSTLTYWASWGIIPLPEGASGSVIPCVANSYEVFRIHFVEINWIDTIKKSWKICRDLWISMNDQSTQNLRSFPSYLTYEPPLIFFLSVFYMAFLCYYNCSGNIVAEWRNYSNSSEEVVGCKN